MIYVLEIFFFDDSHLSKSFFSWRGLIDYVSAEVDLDDVFRLYVRVD